MSITRVFAMYMLRKTDLMSSFPPRGLQVFWESVGRLGGLELFQPQAAQITITPAVKLHVKPSPTTYYPSNGKPKSHCRLAWRTLFPALKWPKWFAKIVRVMQFYKVLYVSYTLRCNIKQLENSQKSQNFDEKCRDFPLFLTHHPSWSLPILQR